MQRGESIRGHLAGSLGRVPGIPDLYFLLRQPREELIVWRDYLQTRRETAFLRNRPTTTNGPTVLLPLLTGWVYEINLHLMFATALRLAGWRPLALLPPRHHARRPLRYSRAFGVEDVVFYDDVELTDEERTLCRTHAAALTSDQLTFQGIKEWSFRQAWVGPQVLSTVSRTNFRGAPDPSDPDIRQQIVSSLPAVLERVIHAERLFDLHRPQLVLAHEANYATYGPLVDVAVARNVDVIHFTQTWRDDAFTCKRLTPRTRRHHHSSLDEASFKRLSVLPWTTQKNEELMQSFKQRYGGEWVLQRRNQPGTRSADRRQLEARFDLDPAKRIGVIFSHVLWDANLFYGEDLFEDYGEWFVETVRAACDNPSLNWLVKLHPANKWKRAYEKIEGEYSEVQLLDSHIGKLPGHVQLLFPDVDVSTLSLYQHGDYGITVRGTPGMEMPCFGKPVLTAGTGRYSGFGFTIDSGSRREYLERISTLHEVPPLDDAQVEAARRHAHAVFLLRLWRMMSFRSEFRFLAKGAHPLDHKLRVQARSIAEMERLGDLRRWAQWAGESDQVDYLEDDAVIADLEKR